MNEPITPERLAAIELRNRVGIGWVRGETLDLCAARSAAWRESHEVVEVLCPGARMYASSLAPYARHWRDRAERAEAALGARAVVSAPQYSGRDVELWAHWLEDAHRLREAVERRAAEYLRRAERAEAVAAARLDVLRQIERSGMACFDYVAESGYCPVCEWAIDHADGCSLFSVLRDDCGVALLAERDALRIETDRLRKRVAELVERVLRADGQAQR